jgi:hypothetical protein
MIKLNDLKEGDFVVAVYEGQQTPGYVKELNREDKEVCITTDVQDFWFKPEALNPIPLNADQLHKLNFEAQAFEDGSVKYSKGPFRIFLPQKDNFSNFDMWYREDRRHLNQPISVHQLQNHYHDMTKVDLARN